MIKNQLIQGKLRILLKAKVDRPTSSRLRALLHPLIARGWIGCRLNDGPDRKLIVLVGWDRSFRLLLGTPGLN